MTTRSKADDQNKPVGEMTKKDLMVLIVDALKPPEELQLKPSNQRLKVCGLKEKDAEIEDLQLRLDERDQYSRRNNLRIFGVPETKKENTDNLVLKVAQKVGVTIDKSEIDWSHRIGKVSGEKPRPIIVKFIGYATRSVFSAKKALKGSGWTVREDLTKQRLALLKRAVDHYSMANVWTYDGVIMVKVGEDVRSLRVKCDSELDSLIRRHPPAPTP